MTTTKMVCILTALVGIAGSVYVLAGPRDVPALVNQQAGAAPAAVPFPQDAAAPRSFVEDTGRIPEPLPAAPAARQDDGELARLRDRVADLEAECAALRRELDLERFPADTAYGAFLRSPDALVVTEDEARSAVRAKLDDFPVELRNGEAVWIAEQFTDQRWKRLGDDPHEVLVNYLGYDRLLAELPPEQAATLRAYFDSAVTMR
jgi:hypothetical protein